MLSPPPLLFPKTNASVHTSTCLRHLFCGWISIGLLLFCLGAVPSTAQSNPVEDPFFVKFGAGFSDYTGDFPAQNSGHPLDFQDFVRSFAGTASGFPYMSSGELGYRSSQNFAAVLGVVSGVYPIAGYAGGGAGTRDVGRYTFQLLGRYTFGKAGQDIVPYVDGGVNLTAGGPGGTGFGPSLGGGLSIPFNRSVSFFVESRLNVTYPDDALDGSKSGDSFIGGVDMANQLLGAGLRVSFGGFTDEDTQSSSARVPPDTVYRTPDNEARTAPPDTSHYGDMTRVPSGTFIMGLTDEDPLSLQSAGRKRVTVSSFYIDQHEVTNAEYREYLSKLSPDERKQNVPDSTAWTDARSQEDWSSYFRSEFFSDHPVLAITWDEAQAYCQAQNKRLPTEAEWEYAARGGHVGRVYPWEGLSTQNEDGQYRANYNPENGYAADGHAFTAPVDAFFPNDWGLHNMAGNVAEWTRDAYTPSYDNISDFNPRHVDEDESRRVVRGGAWNSNSFAIGVGVRDTQPRDKASATIGFRCVQDVASVNRERRRKSSPEPDTMETDTTETDTGGQQ